MLVLEVEGAEFGADSSGGLHEGDVHNRTSGQSIAVAAFLFGDVPDACLVIEWFVGLVIVLDKIVHNVGWEKRREGKGACGKWVGSGWEVVGGVGGGWKMPAGVDWEDEGEEGWDDDDYDEYEDDSPDDADGRQVGSSLV